MIFVTPRLVRPMAPGEVPLRLRADHRGQQPERLRAVPARDGSTRWRPGIKQDKNDDQELLLTEARCRQCRGEPVGRTVRPHRESHGRDETMRRQWRTAARSSRPGRRHRSRRPPAWGSIRECLGTEEALLPPQLGAVRQRGDRRGRGRYSPDVVIMGFDGNPEEAVRLGPLLAEHGQSKGLQMVAISERQGRAPADPGGDACRLPRVRRAARKMAHLLRQAVHESTLSSPGCRRPGTAGRSGHRRARGAWAPPSSP